MQIRASKGSYQKDWLAKQANVKTGSAGKEARIYRLAAPKPAELRQPTRARERLACSGCVYEFAFHYIN